MFRQARRGVRSPGTGALDIWCWELYLCPLEEQSMHLVTEPSLQLQGGIFFLRFILNHVLFVPVCAREVLSGAGVPGSRESSDMGAENAALLPRRVNTCSLNHPSRPGESFN